MKRVVYYVFDLLFLNGEDCREKPLRERKERLKKLLTQVKNPRIRYSDHVQGPADDLFKAACEKHLEGLISKDRDSPYHSGRSDSWVKAKCKMRQEFVIGGYAESKGARGKLGALLLGVYDGRELRYAGKVGTGFTEKSATEVFGKLRRRELKRPPFKKNLPHEARLHWARPELVAEVAFSNWTEDGLLRQAVFHGLRGDKEPREIHREDLIQTLSEPGSLSNPDKVLYKKEGITKLQVARYYQDVAALILPHIANRPLSLLRCPEGSTQNCFFQKHLSGEIPEHISAETCLTINSKEGLFALAQLRVFELHAWGCHKDHIERPDQIVMDLDPGPGVSWSRVVATALELRQIFEDIDLKSFVKVSGGKGLHIHVPVAPLYSWDQIKSFAKTIGREMVTRHPDLYTIKMSKLARQKRIFIDYFRNGRGATSVVPYSLRARSVSAVAMPVSWEELSRLRGPDVFTLQKAYDYLHKRKKDPWRDFFKREQRISILNPLFDKDRE